MTVMGSQLGPAVYKSLQGILCVYKPAGMSMSAMNSAFSLMLSNELGKLPLNAKHAQVINHTEQVARQLSEKYKALLISSPLPAQTASDLPVKTAGATESVSSLIPQTETDSDAGVRDVPPHLSPLQMSASDVQYHPQVMGNLWRPEDIHITSADSPTSLTSGVLPMSIGNEEYRQDLETICQSNPIKVYRVTAQLGLSTDNMMLSGRVTERSTYRHITQSTLDRVITAIQATHQKEQFKLMGVSMNTQEAYELASRGLIRPPYDSEAKQPVVYGIKTVGWEPPNLTLEIHIVNETGSHLLELVHKMGVDLRCGAACSKIRRIRYGHFDLSHCLVRQQWNYTNIISNFEKCMPALTDSMTDRMEQITLAEQLSSRVISSSKQTDS